MTANKSFQFDYNGKSITLALPPRERDDIRSFFAVGLPKAGSTLMNRLLQPLSIRAGLVPYGLHEQLRSLGLPISAVRIGAEDLFEPFGYAFLRFRHWSPENVVPNWADGRLLFLVRDPRDMIVSGYFSEAFSHRPPGAAVDDTLARTFAERRVALQTVSLDDYALQTAQSLSERYAQTRATIAPANPRIWRYEDIVFDKLRWTHEMLDYLGLKLPGPMIERIVERNDVRPTSEAVDQHVRKVTPGDHREKLKPETIAQLNRILGEMLAEHHYA